MKIKKFNEKYEFDYDNDIVEEYAKAIISDYIDNILNEKTLEESFVDYTKELYEQDENEHRTQMIKHKIIILCKRLLFQAKNIRSFIKIETDKYNV